MGGGADNSVSDSTAEVAFQIHTLGQERKDFQKSHILMT